jgi:ketosteroid isomerase-like protein
MKPGRLLQGIQAGCKKNKSPLLPVICGTPCNEDNRNYKRKHNSMKLMLTKPDAKKFAKEWVESWNSHDIDNILSHYSDDIEIKTPMIKLAAGIESESLKGKALVSDYWEKALKRIPGLHFELVDVAEGVDSVALYYKSVMNKMAIEVMFFNNKGKVSKMFAHYT